MAGGWRDRGGILWLLDLIEEHRGAIEYDFRTRFHLPLDVVSDGMGWGEAVRLVRILQTDPSSMTFAAVAGWSHPITREALALFDIYDLTVRVNSKAQANPEPHNGRPWKRDDTQRIQRGNAAGRTPEQIKAILRGQFGQPEVPA